MPRGAGRRGAAAKSCRAGRIGSILAAVCRWVLALALVASASTIAGAQAAGRPATLATFALGWGGYDRGMGINRWGRGYVQINSGASCACVGVALPPSHGQGTAARATPPTPAA